MKTLLAIVFAGTMLVATAATAFANAQPPTNGGNGGGQSGQCTGPADERPHGCHTYK